MGRPMGEERRMSTSDREDIQAIRNTILSTGRSTKSAGKALSGLAQVMLQISSVKANNIRKPSTKFTGKEEEKMTELQSTAKSRIRVKRNLDAQRHTVQEKAYESGFESGYASGKKEGFKQGEDSTKYITRTQARNLHNSSSMDIDEYRSCRYKYYFELDRRPHNRSLSLRVHIERTAEDSNVTSGYNSEHTIYEYSLQDQTEALYMLTALFNTCRLRVDTLSFVETLVDFIYDELRANVGRGVRYSFKSITDSMSKEQVRMYILRSIGYEDGS